MLILSLQQSGLHLTPPGTTRPTRSFLCAVSGIAFFIISLCPDIVKTEVDDDSGWMDGTLYHHSCSILPHHAQSWARLSNLNGPICQLGARWWSGWGPWSACSVTCGSGMRSRRRHCMNSSNHTLEDQSCQGKSAIDASCSSQHCTSEKADTTERYGSDKEDSGSFDDIEEESAKNIKTDAPPIENPDEGAAKDHRHDKQSHKQSRNGETPHQDDNGDQNDGVNEGIPDHDDMGATPRGNNEDIDNEKDTANNEHDAEGQHHDEGESHQKETRGDYNDDDNDDMEGRSKAHEEEREGNFEKDDADGEGDDHGDDETRVQDEQVGSDGVHSADDNPDNEDDDFDDDQQDDDEDNDDGEQGGKKKKRPPPEDEEEEEEDKDEEEEKKNKKKRKKKKKKKKKRPTKDLKIGDASIAASSVSLLRGRPGRWTRPTKPSTLLLGIPSKCPADSTSSSAPVSPISPFTPDSDFSPPTLPWPVVSPEPRDSMIPGEVPRHCHTSSTSSSSYDSSSSSYTSSMSSYSDEYSSSSESEDLAQLKIPRIDLDDTSCSDQGNISDVKKDLDTTPCTSDVHLDKDVLPSSTMQNQLVGSS